MMIMTIDVNSHRPSRICLLDNFFEICCFACVLHVYEVDVIFYFMHLSIQVHTFLILTIIAYFVGHHVPGSFCYHVFFLGRLDLATFIILVMTNFDALLSYFDLVVSWGNWLFLIISLKIFFRIIIHELVSIFIILFLVGTLLIGACYQ